MKKILKLLLWILLSWIVLVFGFGLYGHFLANSIENAANEKLFGFAKEIKMNGFTFRDLNKNNKLDSYEDSRVSVNNRVEDLLAQMTIEEKAGLMLIPILLYGETTSRFFNKMVSEFFFLLSLDPLVIKEIKHITSFFGTDDPSDHAKWQNNLQKLAEQTRLGIPVSINSDPRHSNKSGPAVRMDCFSKWPDPLGFAAIADSNLVTEFGRIAAQEYRAVGIHTAQHPMADLATEPRWARISGTFGEDAELSAKLTAAYIKGFQGDHLTSKSVACMTKHFSGGGPQKGGRDAHFKYGKNQVYPGNNFDYHLIPFKAAIKANTSQMMAYYGIPLAQTSEDVGFAFNKEIISDLLQKQMGFEGIVSTDGQVITDFNIFFGFTLIEAKDHGVEYLSPIEKVEKAIHAGIDQFAAEDDPSYIIELVKTGRIPEERINKSVRKLLKLKFQMGLFENPYVDEIKARQICGSSKFVEKGKVAMRRSTVLLKNKINNGLATIPLKRNVKVYVEGYNKGKVSKYVTVVENLNDADYALLNLNTPYEPRKGIIESILHQGSLEFSTDNLKSLLSIINAKPSIVSIYLERAAVIPEIAVNSSALIAHFGSSDEVTLELIFGEFEATGKLPIELPSSTKAVEEQLEDVPYDSKNPLFRFGAGIVKGVVEIPTGGKP